MGVECRGLEERWSEGEKKGEDSTKAWSDEDEEEGRELRRTNMEGGGVRQTLMGVMYGLTSPSQSVAAVGGAEML